MTWTPDRPTKPGRYWLSVHRDKRTANEMNIPHCLDVHLRGSGSIEAEGCAEWSHLLDPLLDGALWRKYEEPADPHVQTEPVEKLPSADDLVKAAIRLMRTPRRRYSRSGKQRPLWARVMMLFGHGSTYSRAICRAYGFDPDEVWMPPEGVQ